MFLCWELGGSAATKEMLTQNGAHRENAECIKGEVQRVKIPCLWPRDGSAATGAVGEASVELKRLVVAADILESRIKGLRKSYTIQSKALAPVQRF